MHSPSPAQRLAALKGRQLFFVGGPAKSGTTWLQHLLHAHPELACRGEGHLTKALVPLLKATLEQYNAKVATYNGGLFKETAGFPTFDGDDLQHVISTAVGLLLGHLALDKPSARAIGEKTPANIHDFGLLHWLAPGCVLACTVRDPRDAFTSNWRQTQRVNPSYIAREHGGQMSRFALTYGRKWASVVTAGLQAKKAAPDRVFLMRYEDLHTQPIEELTPVLQRLGVAHDADTVQQCVESASFGKLSGGRQPGEESAGSFFRKGVVGDWKNHLDAESVAVLVRETGPLLQHFGYPL